MNNGKRQEFRLSPELASNVLISDFVALLFLRLGVRIVDL